MSTKVHYLRLVVAVDYLIAKRHSSFMRPRLVMVHGHHQPGGACVPGETLESAHLQYFAPDLVVPIRLSHAGLIVCDCLAQFRQTPLSIRRMERILTTDPFYRRLGANSSQRNEDVPKFTRASLRVYVARLREQIAKALIEGGSLIPVNDVFASEITDSNTAVHRLKLAVEIVHKGGARSIRNDQWRERSFACRPA